MTGDPTAATRADARLAPTGADAAYAELVARLRRQPWYLVADDEVGGYALANRDVPTSQLDLDRGDRLVADVVHRDLGEHVAALHAAWLDDLAVADAPAAPPDRVALGDVVRRTVLAELRALVDAAFPSEHVDHDYGCESLLALTQERRRALEDGAPALAPLAPGEEGSP